MGAFATGTSLLALPCDSGQWCDKVRPALLPTLAIWHDVLHLFSTLPHDPMSARLPYVLVFERRYSVLTFQTVSSVKHFKEQF